MSKEELSNDDYIIRIIVKEIGKEEVPQFIRCRIVDNSIPSRDKIINYLVKREGYEEGTNYNITGFSAFLEEEAERFPDIIK